jgi:predicted Rossmann-fold nucleotide-binding protein
MMNLGIGVIGLGSRPPNVESTSRRLQLGRAIAEHGCTLLVRAGPELPHPVLEGARQAGGLIVGISPAKSAFEHSRQFGGPADSFDVLICTGVGLEQGETEVIRSSDIVIIAGARSGLTDELTLAYDERRPIGILTQTRSVATSFERLARVCGKPTGGAVLCDDDPVHLVNRLVALYYATDFRCRTPVGSTGARRGQPTRSEHEQTCGAPEWSVDLLPPAPAARIPAARIG